MNKTHREGASEMVIATNYASLYGCAFNISSFSTGPDIYMGVSRHSCNCFGSCVLCDYRSRGCGGFRNVLLGDLADHQIMTNTPSREPGVGNHIDMENRGTWHHRRSVVLARSLTKSSGSSTASRHKWDWNKAIRPVAKKAEKQARVYIPGYWLLLIWNICTEWGDTDIHDNVTLIAGSALKNQSEQ